MKVHLIYHPETAGFYVHISFGDGYAMMFNGVTKPTARQIRRWKKQASAWYRYG